MNGPASGLPRVLRSGAFALAAVSLALGAHGLGGGTRPGALAMAAAVLLVGCAATLATGRRLGRLATTSGLVLSQLALHTWFSLAGAAGCDIGGLVLSGHHHALPDCTPGSTEAAGPVGAALGWGAAMPVAHLAAVLGTALLLAHGEALLWRLADLAGGWWPRVLPSAAVPAGPRRGPAPAARVARPAGLALLDPARRRGPPVPATG